LRRHAQLNPGLLFAKEHNVGGAETDLKAALSLDPSFTPATVNLADRYRQTGREQDGEAVLRHGLQRSPHNASLLHALGLLMVRQKHRARALKRLAEVAHIDPANARYSYVYAVALNDAGQTRAAIAMPQHSVKLHPYDPDTLGALATFLEQAGERAAAQTYRQRLDQLAPKNP